MQANGLLKVAEKLRWQDGPSKIRASGASLVCLVHLVSLIQPNKPDRLAGYKQPAKALWVLTVLQQPGHEHGFRQAQDSA